MIYLSSLNELSAAEGLPVVLIGALQAFGALALIVMVLFIMDKIYKKNKAETPDNNADVLSQEDNEAGENE